MPETKVADFVEDQRKVPKLADSLLILLGKIEGRERPKLMNCTTVIRTRGLFLRSEET